MSVKPIVLVEDNMEDCEFLVKALTIVGLDHPIKCFDNAMAALKFLKEPGDDPLVIISDIAMPVMNGIEFRREILADAEINAKEIPFVFLSTLAPGHYTKLIKKLNVQGHFKKPSDFKDMLHITRSIIESWSKVS